MRLAALKSHPSQNEGWAPGDGHCIEKSLKTPAWAFAARGRLLEKREKSGTPVLVSVNAPTQTQ
jgi:hypothetical protein